MEQGLLSEPLEIETLGKMLEESRLRALDGAIELHQRYGHLIQETTEFGENIKGIFNGTISASALEKSYLCDKDGNTYSHYVCMSGNVSLLEKLIDECTFSSEPNNFGLVPIHVASASGHPKCVEYLIASGHHIPSDYNKFKLLIACCDVNGQVCSQPIENVHPIEVAILLGKTEVVYTWLSKMEDREKQKNGVYGNLIHLSILSKRSETLACLLKDKKVRKLINEEGGRDKLTPLMSSLVHDNNEAIAELCITAGININHQSSSDSSTVFHLAVRCRSSLPVFRLLLYYSATGIDSRDSSEKTPLALAQDLKNQEENVERKDELALVVNFLKTKSRVNDATKFNLNIGDFKQRRIQNLVFQGGGPKGVVHLGAIKYLEEMKRIQEVERVAGTSAGSIVALGVALGFNNNELLDLLKSMDMLSFLEGANIDALTHVAGSTGFFDGIIRGVGALFEVGRIAYKKTYPEGLGFREIFHPVETAKKAFGGITGLSTGAQFTDWVTNRVIKFKLNKIRGYENHDGLLTFGELAELRRRDKSFKHLFVVTMDIRSQEILVLNSEDERWKDVEVASAIRASMSIPGVFEPCKLRVKPTSSRQSVALEDYYCVDGGTIKNYPIEIFDKVRYVYPHYRYGNPDFRIHNPNTFGFSIGFSEEGPDSVNEMKKIQGSIGVMKAIAGIYYESENLLAQFLGSREGRTIVLNPCGVDLLDFDLLVRNPKKVAMMIEKAHESCVNSKIGTSPLVKLNTQLSSSAAVLRTSPINEGLRAVKVNASESEINELLTAVYRGELDKVRECLTNNKSLVYAQGNLKDLSGREFNQITGFQYAVWSGDEELWNIFLEFLPEKDAYAQLMALTKERSDITQKHEAPLSFFDPLLNAYKRYLDNYDKWCKGKNWDQVDACWCKEVGGAQRNMPAWFIHMFSEEGTYTAWPKKHLTIGFTREAHHIKVWFEHEQDGGKCGISFAFCRGGGALRCFSKVDRSWARALIRIDWCDSSAVDYENSITLKTEYTKKLAALTERLSRAAKSEPGGSSFGIRK